MNRKYSRFILVVAGLVAVVGGGLAWETYAEHRTWNLLRPTFPLVDDSTPGLAARLASCNRRLNSWPPDAAALAEFTRLCHANGKFDAATSGYRALMTMEPLEPRWPYLLGSILADSGRLEEARPLFQQTTLLSPDLLVGWLKLADAFLKSNATSEAETAYGEVLRRDKDNPFALLGLARCDLQAERLTAARSHLRQAVAAHPDFDAAHNLLGTVFERLGNVEAATNARKRAEHVGSKVRPSDPWVEELILDCHDPYTLLTAASEAMADGNPRKSLPLLNRALGLAPQDARLHRQLSKTLAALGDSSGARSQMEQAVALAPSNDALQLDLLALLRRIPDEPAAERAIASGVTACPDSAALHFEAGLLAAHAGRLDEAATHFEFARINRPDKTDAAIELATVNFRQGRDVAGIALLEEVLSRFPQEANAHVLLIRRGIEIGDAHTPSWLQRAADAGLPSGVLAELRHDYTRRSAGFSR